MRISADRSEHLSEANPSSIEETGRKQKISRRKFLLGLLGGAAAVPLVAGSYARWIEPDWLQDRKLTCYLDRLPPSFDGLTIAHISDLHYGDHVHSEDIERILERVMSAKPDIICLTGDLVDDRSGRTNGIVEVMSKFRAPLGQYAVLGNHDYSRGDDIATDLLIQAGFDVLTNQHRMLQAGGAHLAIAGIDDALDGSPDLDRALGGIPSGTCCVLLAHEPDIADWSITKEVDLQLSGHSHGGQIRLPFIGPMFLPNLGEKYPDGKYILSRSLGHHSIDTPLTVYTSRGTGTSLLPLRFSCPPEWTLITLRVVAV